MYLLQEFDIGADHNTMACYFFELYFLHNRATKKIMIIIMKDSRYFCTSDLVEHLFLLIIKNLFSNPIEVDSCYFSKYYSTLKWIWTLKKKEISCYWEMLTCMCMWQVWLFLGPYFHHRGHRSETKCLPFWSLLSSGENKVILMTNHAGQRGWRK